MCSHTVFIDGQAGTTGLQIHERLKCRSDIELISLKETERRSVEKRKELLNTADISILCLPDDAATEAVCLVENPKSRIIDTSSAHRTSEGWVYGLPELDVKQKQQIASARRLSNPGCYANASISILRPLILNKLLPVNSPIYINAISGYSGGGTKLIESFENERAENHISDAFRIYGLSLDHKHIPEIQHWSGLTKRPLFVPSVGRFKQGMIVQVPLHLSTLPNKPSPFDIYNTIQGHYKNEKFIKVSPLHEAEMISALEPEFLNKTDLLHIHVLCNKRHQQVLLVAVLDNLGRGASGQAVQNMNIMLGLSEQTGLKEKN